MNAIFKGENILEFTESFHDDKKCLEYIAGEKWKDDHACRHYGHKTILR